jgi:DNA primase
LSGEDQGLLHELGGVHGEVLAWLERQITEHGPQTWSALDAAMADEPWAGVARGWLAAVVADEEHGFEDLQRVLQRMWIEALGDDAHALASGVPDAEGLARLRQLRERIAALKAQLTGQAGQAA